MSNSSLYEGPLKVSLLKVLKRFLELLWKYLQSGWGGLGVETRQGTYAMPMSQYHFAATSHRTS